MNYIRIIILIFCLVPLNLSVSYAEIEKHQRGSISSVWKSDNKYVHPFSAVRFFTPKDASEKEKAFAPASLLFGFGYSYYDRSGVTVGQQRVDVERVNDRIFENTGKIYIDDKEYSITLKEQDPMLWEPGVAVAMGFVDISNLTNKLKSARKVSFRLFFRIRRVQNVLWEVPNSVLKEWKSLL